MISEPSVLTVDDFNKLFEQKKNWKEKIIFCSWCNESTFVRDVGPNYICYECEKKERAAGRPLVFTTKAGKPRALVLG